MSHVNNQLFWFKEIKRDQNPFYNVEKLHNITLFGKPLNASNDLGLFK